MKKNLLILSLLLITQLGFAQSFCNEPVASYTKLENCKEVVRSEILSFNEMAKHYGLIDTISYECTNEQLALSYQGKSVTDWKYDPKLCGKKLMLRYGKYSSSFQLLASIPLGNGKAQIYEVIKPNKGKKRIIFKAYKEMGILPYGEYIEKNCAGQITVKGQYELVDTPSTYSYKRYDSEQKKHLTERIDNKKTSQKKGIWNYYNEQGELAYQENYSAKQFKLGQTPQDLCSNFERNIKWNYYTIEDKISPAIAIFNAIHTSLGRDNYLTYDITHRGLIYYHNGKMIPSPFFDMKGKYREWDYQLRNSNNNLLLEHRRGNRLRAYIPSSDSEAKGENLVFEKKLGIKAPTLDIFQTIDYQLNGKYERRNCNGEILFQGNYTTKNTPHTIREYKINPDTYQKEWVETTLDFMTVRTGKWSYFNKEGEAILEENYPGKMKWVSASDYLCTKQIEEAREIARNLSNPFLVFNAMCHLSSLDYWLSEDDVLERKSYYLNGQLIDSPENISKQNYIGDYKFQTPNATIKIRANTRQRGVLRSGKKKRKLNYRISLSFKDDKNIRLSFYRDKLTKQEIVDGKNDGAYEERLCDGNLLIKGQYCQIDSF